MKNAVHVIHLGRLVELPTATLVGLAAKTDSTFGDDFKQFRDFHVDPGA
jgi:tRNA A37 threonylcarbamoyladenosine synthetase subunit TsaC/SUA5/YrdC